MILFPAIDLKDGLAVRLQQGDMARATVFNYDPAAQAHAFEQQGFRHLHVVDLDGSGAGKPMNGAAVERILETVGLCVQLGGGIRDMATIEGWLEKGVDRVIIGTAAVRGPALVQGGRRRDTRGASRWGSMRATARSRSRAGPNSRSSRCSISRAASRTRASRRSSTPTLSATACCRGSTGTPPSRLPMRSRPR